MRTPDDSEKASDLQVEIARKVMTMIGEEKLEKGTYLRELDLAKRFQVSRSPVRASLKFLANLGVVEQRANHGFFLLRDGGEIINTSLGLPKSGDEQICQRIGKDWFDKNIDKEISETALRKRYGLGRTVAGRILQKLSEQGIITRLPGYGWRFEPTLDSQSTHDESYEFRLLNEPASILLPSFELNEARAAHLRIRHEALMADKKTQRDIVAAFELDANFHEFIAECSGNRFLLDAMVRQNRLRRLVEYNSLMDTGRIIMSIKEHLAIMAALHDKDNKRAAALMREHLLGAKAAGGAYKS